MKAYVGVDVLIHVSLISAVVGGEWSASSPGPSNPGKGPPLPIGQEVGWAPVPALIWLPAFLYYLDLASLSLENYCHILQPSQLGSFQCSSTFRFTFRAGIATVYELEGRGLGVRLPVRARFSFSPRRPDRLWGPPSHLSNSYRRFLIRRQSGRGVKLTTQLQLCQDQDYVDLYIPSPIRLHGVVFN
jgi:hypothetical protein